MCQLTCGKKFLMRFSNKIVDLDLAPFNMVDNQCCRRIQAKV